MKLDELTNHLRATHHLGNTQNEIGCSHSIAQTAAQVNTNNVRRQEVDRLAQHSSLGFDATDTPTNNTQTVDHSRVRIRADERVGIVNILLPNVLCEILEIDLVTDADARRNDRESVESLCAPFQKLISRAIAPELDLHVLFKRIASAGEI